MDEKIHFILNENKSWMPEEKIFVKIRNALQNMLTNFFVSKVFQ
jgi:hypothetical protein